MDAITYSNVGLKDLQARIAELNAANSNMQISVDKTGNAQATFTVTTGGKTYTVPCTLSLPQIDQAEGTSSTEELDKVIATLEQCISELEALAAAENGSSDSSSTSVSTASIYFNLYDAIALLKQTAQKQREVALSTRQQQHEAVRESMLSEADMITENAESAYNNAMTLQIVNTVVSAGALCVTLGSAYAQRSAIKGSEASKTNAQIDTLNATSKEMSGAKAEIAKMDVAEAKEQQALQQARQMQKRGPEVRLPDTGDIELADLSGGQLKVDDVKPNANNNPANTLDVAKRLPKSDVARTNTEVKKADVTKAENELKTAKEELTQAIKTKDSDKISAAEQKVEKKSLELEDKRTAYAQAMSEEAKTIKAEIAEKGYVAETDEGKAVRRYQLERLDEMSPDMKECVESVVKDLNVKYDQQVRAAMETRKYQRAQNAITATNQGFQTIQAGFNMIEASQQKSAELERAKEKRKEAEQEAIRSDLEATNEEVQRTHDLIQECNDLIKSISESERQAALSIAQRI